MVKNGITGKFSRCWSKLCSLFCFSGEFIMDVIFRKDSFFCCFVKFRVFRLIGFRFCCDIISFEIS